MPTITLWRISSRDALDGVGAARSGGRWNSPGYHVVYLAEVPAGAMLEVLVHLAVDSVSLPDSYRLMKLAMRIDSPVSTLAVPPGDTWQGRIEQTRRIGDSWLKRATAPLVRVPSAVMPHTWNYLLDPNHPEAARIRLVSKTEHLFDPRLLRIPIN